MGEDRIVYSEESEYGGNIEKGEVVYEGNEKHEDLQSLTKIERPNIHTG